MIDNISLYTTISPEYIKRGDFIMNKKHPSDLSEYGVDEVENGSVSYIKKLNRVTLIYFPNTHKLMLTGNLLGIDSVPRAVNIDDVAENRVDMINQAAKVSKAVNEVLTDAKTDILNWHLTRCDFCFNIKTPYFERYIEFFNLYYEYSKEQNFKSYINFACERKCKSTSSFYLKPKAQYKRNINQNFTLNIYNKTDQLKSIQKSQLAKFGKSSIKDADFAAAEDILRIEVQSHHGYLKKICQRNNINFKNLTLRDLLDIDISRNAVVEKLIQFFTYCDFYSYGAANKKIAESGMKVTQRFREYLLSRARRNNVSSVAFDNKLKALGIFPYMFIPEKWNIDKLENPVRLIDRKIEENNRKDLKAKGVRI